MSEVNNWDQILACFSLQPLARSGNTSDGRPRERKRMGIAKTE
jgi:hypothetical protein